MVIYSGKVTLENGIQLQLEESDLEGKQDCYCIVDGRNKGAANFGF